MIRYATGNLLEAPVQALVNTVNTVGVMGKGIALQFKEAFPANFEAYRAAAKLEEIEIGRMFVTETSRWDDPRWVINFPTKKHWRHPSRLEWIQAGLVDLRRVIRERGIRSVAVPPLGCGNGGLDWALVRQAIESTLGELSDVQVLVYGPTDAYQAAPKRAGVEDLTPARAMLVDLVRRYSLLGFECTNLELQKLAYFLQRVVVGLRLDNPLELKFVADKFGPYADNLRHALNDLDGSYLHCERRLADAGPLDAITLDLSRLGAVKVFLATESASYGPALAEIDALIDGFQSPFLMELLATVDWILQSKGSPLTGEQVLGEVKRWAGGPAAARRKARLFKDNTVAIALQRLQRHAPVLYPGRG